MDAISEGKVIAGRYRLESPLSTGGMGAVWVARHLQLDNRLAIKFIDKNLCQNAEAKARFEREAKAAALLHGPNIVEIHDYGIEGDTPYIVMELLEGEDLASRLARERRLPIEEAVHIVSQVARVLKRAHAAGVVHRDLKPGNVFLVRSDDDDEVVKILDFGVAKVPKGNLDDDSTKTGMLLGSPRYMSPEQARGSKQVDHRSDLWSLAVIAYRALTGELPFPGREIGDVIVRICTEDAPPPSTYAPELGPEIDQFFARAFDRDPNKRFQSARELATAFSYAAGLPPPSYRLDRRSSLFDLTAAPAAPDSAPSNPRPSFTPPAAAPPPKAAPVGESIPAVAQTVMSSRQRMHTPPDSETVHQPRRPRERAGSGDSISDTGSARISWSTADANDLVLGAIPRRRRRRVWPGIAAAATLAVVVISILVLYVVRPSGDPHRAAAQAPSVAPPPAAPEPFAQPTASAAPIAAPAPELAPAPTASASPVTPARPGAPPIAKPLLPKRPPKKSNAVLGL